MQGDSTEHNPNHTRSFDVETKTREQSSKRVMTSAIPRTTVAEVRTVLKRMRERWSSHLEDEEPFQPGQPIFKGQTMEQFALSFVLGHHQRRSQKSKPS